jgi:hypothetical protein
LNVDCGLLSLPTSQQFWASSSTMADVSLQAFCSLLNLCFSLKRFWFLLFLLTGTVPC